MLIEGNARLLKVKDSVKANSLKQLVAAGKDPGRTLCTWLMQNMLELAWKKLFYRTGKATLLQSDE